ncbi:hypothetical protein ACFRAQ_35850 [Nocardia sp. NPDC056611]|uniref:hypothetical protein n=1 Tax=Nocardia sp. NPDC056611 TaxID=3345877 RepID=UPI00366F1032
MTGTQLRRLWDKDFNLVHTFTEGESWTEFAIDHPATKHIFDTFVDRWENVHLTVDENGKRSTLTLSELVSRPATISGRLDNTNEPSISVGWSDFSDRGDKT